MIQFLVLIAAFGASMAFGQDVPAPTPEDWEKFLAALGGLSGLQGLGVAALVVQGLMLLLKSQLGKYAGKYQLVVVMGLSLVSGSIALKMTGLDWASVLVHSSTLGAVQVFLHQIYKQFLEKK